MMILFDDVVIVLVISTLFVLKNNGIEALQAVTAPWQSSSHRNNDMGNLYNRFNHRNSASVGSSSLSYSTNSKSYDTTASSYRQLSFEDQMRDIALKEQQKQVMRQLRPPNMKVRIATPSSKTKQKPDHIIEVTTLSQFEQVVFGESDASVATAATSTETTSTAKTISAVRWYAPWCKSCYAVEPAFYSLQRKLSKLQSSSNIKNVVQYLDVPITKDNIQLHIGFGVTKVPYGHIYHSDIGLVEEIKLNVKTIKDFQSILLSYMNNICSLPEDIDPISGIYESPYVRLS